MALHGKNGADGDAAMVKQCAALRRGVATLPLAVCVIT